LDGWNHINLQNGALGGFFTARRSGSIKSWRRIAATMMYGHVETVAERVEHMRRGRELQKERAASAPSSVDVQRDGNRLSEHVTDEQMPTSFDYLLTQAVSRIYLATSTTSRARA